MFFYSNNTGFDMEFTAREQGQRQQVKDGCLYILQKNLANDFTSQEYLLRRKGHCKARVKLRPKNYFVEQTNQHTPPLSKSNCEVVKVKVGRKRCATETVKINQQTLAEQLGEISEGAAVNLPVVENLCRNIRSASKEKNIPPLPINIAEILVLPIELQKNNRQKSVLFFESEAGAADRIIAFASVQARQLLVQSENWYGDGTSKV